MGKNRGLGVLGAALLLAGLLGGAAWWSYRPVPTNSNPSDPQVAAGDQLPGGDLDQFVGDGACARCHKAIAQAYARSGMARSWRRLGGRPLGDFERQTPVTDPGSGYHYRMLLEGGAVFQEETSPDRPGESAHRLRVQASYSVGSGNHAQALVTERNGYLHQMPVAWFNGPGWRMNPGYELFNHRFERRIPPGCVACHGPVAEHLAPAANRFKTPLADGIGCERCHGPGRKHVAFWDRAGPDDSAEPTITNPKRLPPDRANDVCLQCHLQGDVTVYPPGGGPFHFRPGDRLRDRRLDFLVKTDKPEALGVASHGARLMQSRCFRAGGAKLTCTHCHDPHVPTREVPSAHFDARCAACHAPESCGRATPPGTPPSAEGCVRCHMPRRATREGQHLVFTDHWIRKRPPAQDARPEPLPVNADAELVSAWPGYDPDPARVGCGYVMLHETMGPQTPALRRGLRLLLDARKKGPLDVEAHHALGSALIALRRGGEGAGVLQALLRDHPGHLPARFRLGIAYDQDRHYDRAVREYEAVVRAAPGWMEPYPLLARLYLFRDRPREAVRLLEQQREFNPDATTYAQLAMARHLQGDPPAACHNLLDEALRRDPRLVTAHLYRAHLDATAGHPDKARAGYHKALELDPDNQAARQGLNQLPPPPK